MGKEIRVYRNEDVQRVVAFIPPNHRHIRLVVEFKDQIIVMNEAAVAAIVRAYIDVATHPTRKAVELAHASITERKPGYAKDQLIETTESEGEIIERNVKILRTLDEAR